MASTHTTHPDPEVQAEIVRMSDFRTAENARRWTPGTRMSGMGLEPIAPVSVEVAERRIAERRAWEQTPDARLVELIVALTAISVTASEDVRACRSRGFLRADGSPNLPNIHRALRALNPLPGSAAREARDIITDLLLVRGREAA